jgi:hypothetical protein
VAKRCSTPSAKGQRRRQNKGAGSNYGGSVEKDTHQMASHRAEVARDLVLDAWAEIVGGLIKKAAEGGYQQAKLLLELCELENTDATELDHQRRAQLCDVLLEQLALSPAAPTNPIATVDNSVEPYSQERD